MIGIEAALYLADKGCAVTIVEENKEAMQGDLASFRTPYLTKLAEKNIPVHLSTKIEKAEDGAVVTVNKKGVKKMLLADTVVNATGYVPNEDLLNELKQKTALEVYTIGDGKEPGKVFDAIHGGYLLGRQI